MCCVCLFVCLCLCPHDLPRATSLTPQLRIVDWTLGSDSDSETSALLQLQVTMVRMILVELLGRWDIRMKLIQTAFALQTVRHDKIHSHTQADAETGEDRTLVVLHHKCSAILARARRTI